MRFSTQLAVSGFSIERLSRALLDDERLASNQAMPQESIMALANVCLETVLPKDLGSLPVEKIITLKKTAQNRVDGVSRNIWLAFRTEAERLSKNVTGVTDCAAFVQHLEVHYEKTMKPSIDEVRNAFTLMKIETITSIVNINFALPPLLGDAAQMSGLPYDRILGGIAGFAFGVIPMIQKKQAEADASLKKPGAWLLRIEEGLKPHTFMTGSVIVRGSLCWGSNESCSVRATDGAARLNIRRRY